MAATSIRSVKVTLGDDIRRFAFSGSSFAELESILRSTYELGDRTFVCKYEDDEDDVITLSSDQELKIAFDLAPKEILRLTVVIDGQPEPIQPMMEVPLISLNPLEDRTQVSQPPLYPPLEATQRTQISQPPFYSPWEDRTQISQPPPYPSVAEAYRHPNFASSDKDWKKFKHHEHHRKKEEKRMHHLEKRLGHFEKKAAKYGMARLVAHVTPDDRIVPPNHNFVKTWRIRNESSQPWTSDFIFAFKKGDQLSKLECLKLPQEVPQGGEIDISVEMQSPAAFGRYISVWRLVAPNGKPFGQPFHIRVTVADPNAPLLPMNPENDFNARMMELSSMGFDNRELNERVYRKCQGDIDKVVWKLLKKQQKMQFKQEKFHHKMEKLKKKADLV